MERASKAEAALDGKGVETKNVWARRVTGETWHRIEFYDRDRIEALCGYSFVATGFYHVDDAAGPTATPVIGSACLQCQATADQVAFLDVSTPLTPREV